MRKLIAAILSLSLLLTLSSCRFSLKPTYWNGMTKQETEELILGKLEEKYNEEFEILEMYLTYSGGYMTGACIPKSDDGLVFEIELWKYGELYDTYIQSVVRREMKEIIDSVLSEHYENFASEVYVRGLATAYDSGIRSADEASIKTFTEALPEDNLSTIWIAFNEDEIGDDYESIEPFLAEIVESFGLTRAGIRCYFVDKKTVEQCQESILNNHLEYGYDIGFEMDVILSQKRPVYHYAYNGNRFGLKFDHFADDTGAHFPDEEINESREEASSTKD